MRGSTAIYRLQRAAGPFPNRDADHPGRPCRASGGLFERASAASSGPVVSAPQEMEFSWKHWVRVVGIRQNHIPSLSHPMQQVVDEMIWQEDRFVGPPERQRRFEQLGIA